MSTGHLLWVDDEIELLKAHIIFLEKKGYDVTTVSNGTDAIEECRQQTFDLAGRDDAGPDRTGNAASDKGHTARHTRCHGDKE